MRVSLLTNLVAALLASVCAALSNQALAKEASKQKGVIKLTNANFEKVLGGQKDAYLVVLLTSTNPAIGCTLCAELEPEFDLLTESWLHDHPAGLSADGERALFFAKADFDAKKNSKVFVHFNANNVPRLLFISPENAFGTFSQINLPGEPGMTRVAAIMSALKEATGIADFELHQPINWGSIAVTAVATAVIVAVVRRNKALAAKLVACKSIWGLGTVFIIVIWNSGYMFNAIRGSQFAGMSQNGDAVIYFMEGQQQNQFGIETQIVSVIYGILAACTVGLITFVPYAANFYAKDKTGRPSPSKASFVEMILTLSFLITLYAVYSALMAVFGLKSSGYPFRLLRLPGKY
ncbi:LAME_0D06700g1_1 [Lachancea meyersii CBS 8951]|uniref:LAME_0D06700g1_1 n=1 Tax=Lachancea meyersii CBS 8951 TaxID=1266667 RepID=A0A1G4J9J9_9SACH|nr:LAME_0D06700g1_1 [Lachancea meyersii CBS 8951]